MAIIIEEEKNNTRGLAQAAGWLVMLIVLGAAAYYLFFAPAGTSTVTPPASFSEIASLTQLSVSPQAVLQSPQFTSLKSPSFPLPAPSGPAAVGRPNPFIAP
ncbi:MAG TPA: hypothetical protein VHZ04_01890 [Candidatus Paceibacterota bacterium]|jgi:hypothetical protein|nr:hypothetical protein [Candidatus Paceibacterota bacterium]